MRQKASNLIRLLEEYSSSNVYPFHMPGHKRNIEGMPEWNPFKIDITEIDGFDNLYSAEGVLKQVMIRAAKLFHSEYTYLLVNGSTSGILSAIAAVTKPGEQILISRNCHKSVYHALMLNGLHGIYTYPEWLSRYGVYGAVSAHEIKKILEKNKGIKAVVITSPTYEGIVSDIKEIANVVHEYRIPFIVDEAHGAHMIFHKEFPDSAIQLGADIVIHSLHKTLPALTQTALLHLNSHYVEKQRLEKCLEIFQTSSPSYVLMASIEYCILFLEEKSKQMFDKYVFYLKQLRSFINNMKSFGLMNSENCGKSLVNVDISKLGITTCGLTIKGTELYHILRKSYSLQCEMAAKNYVLAMTSIMDTEEGFQRLVQALTNIEKNIKFTKVQEWSKPLSGKILMTIQKADDKEKKRIPLNEARNYISGEFLALYPPGIPFLVPGELITEELLEYIEEYRKLGLEIQGFSDKSGKTILICQE